MKTYGFYVSPRFTTLTQNSIAFLPYVSQDSTCFILRLFTLSFTCYLCSSETTVSPFQRTTCQLSWPAKSHGRHSKPGMWLSLRKGVPVSPSLMAQGDTQWGHQQCAPPHASGAPPLQVVIDGRFVTTWSLLRHVRGLGWSPTGITSHLWCPTIVHLASSSLCRRTELHHISSASPTRCHGHPQVSQKTTKDTGAGNWIEPFVFNRPSYTSLPQISLIRKLWNFCHLKDPTSRSFTPMCCMQTLSHIVNLLPASFSWWLLVPMWVERDVFSSFTFFLQLLDFSQLLLSQPEAFQSI